MTRTRPRVHIGSLHALPPELRPICPHASEPRGCYRVRCQLGRLCVDARSAVAIERYDGRGVWAWVARVIRRWFA